LPREYGHYSTAWRRLKAWNHDGTLSRLWRHLLRDLDAAGKTGLAALRSRWLVREGEKGGDKTGRTRAG